MKEENRKYVDIGFPNLASRIDIYVSRVFLEPIINAYWTEGVDRGVTIRIGKLIVGDLPEGYYRFSLNKRSDIWFLDFIRADCNDLEEIQKSFKIIKNKDFYFINFKDDKFIDLLKKELSIETPFLIQNVDFVRSKSKQDDNYFSDLSLLISHNIKDAVITKWK